jgi:AmmeMemoRadiSam system protein A
MCHAPIVVPAIGGERGDACAATTHAMLETARSIVAHEPDVLVVMSPHAPRHPRAWGIVHETVVSGSFARFGRPDVKLTLPGAQTAAALLAQSAEARGLETTQLAGSGLDHGALVPLEFLVEAGYRGPTLIVALPYPGAGSEESFGRALHQAAEVSGERWAVLASGDMSHRLSRDAPSGYHPRAHEFDSTFAAHVMRGDLRGAVQPDPVLQDLAAEDVVQSTAVVAAAIDYQPRGLRVFSYEGPFGVGYLEALLYSERVSLVDEEMRPPAALTRIAREAISHHLTGRTYAPPSLTAPWDAPRAVFVTLRHAQGELRGCIGRTEPLRSSLPEEVADCAVSAATRDFRMPSVELAELDHLRIEVSVLDKPEPIEGLSELDPSVYGVVVSHGGRRGVLLPNVEGVNSAERQVLIALSKAGIDPSEPYLLERFRVHKVSSH